MKATVKSMGSRIVGAVQDAGRTTGSALAQVAPIPGFLDVKTAATRLLDGLEILEDHRHRCQVLSHRITSVLSALESHCRTSEIGSELRYFYNKLVLCQKQLSRLDSKRGLSNALKASRQLEVIERLEREIDSNLQDVMLSLLIQQLSAPRPTVIYQPVPQATKETPPAQTCYYPIIKRCQLNVDTMIKRGPLEASRGSTVRSVARGKYRNREVLVVQYSGKTGPDQALKAFLTAMSAVIQEQHPNVLRFMGASDKATPAESHYIVFDAGRTIPRESFMQTLRSAKEAFHFFSGVKDGMQFLLDHGIQTWSDIHVSEDGHAIVCPPYWDDVNLWEKSNHDVFSSLTGTIRPTDFPLSTLSEILNTSGARWSEFESVVTSHTTKLRDYHLMQMADDLGLPIPPFLLVYCGSVPDFIISVGSVGIPEGYPEDSFHESMASWTPISSLSACTGWEALQTSALEYWTSEGTPASSKDAVGGFGMPAVAAVPVMGMLEPLDSSSDGWLSYGCFESSETFGVIYELTISDSELFEHSWKRFTETRLASMMHVGDEEQSFHAVRHISVNVHCKPGKMRGCLPLYFHRRPSAMFNVEHYWGFLSDSPDPGVTPCQLVRSIQVEYLIEINTLRANDGWAYRAERCFQSVMSRTPGAFNF